MSAQEARDRLAASVGYRGVVSVRTDHIFGEPHDVIITKQSPGDATDLADRLDRLAEAEAALARVRAFVADGRSRPAYAVLTEWIDELARIAGPTA